MTWINGLFWGPPAVRNEFIQPFSTVASSTTDDVDKRIKYELNKFLGLPAVRKANG